MELSVRDVAALLNVTERVVYRWINEDELPAFEVNGQQRFSRADLLEWAASRKVNAAAITAPAGGETGCDVADALAAGGVLYHVAGDDLQTVLRNIVAQLPLGPRTDRDTLLQLFLAREKVGSTAVGNGIAIPHARYPLILPVSRPLLCLCFLDRAIDYGAADRGAVDTLFVLIAPTIPLHLRMLGGIANLVRDARFVQLLKQRAGHDELMAEARRVGQAQDGPTAVVGQGGS